jgi:DNA replication initiation complex subunit (GINS family)
MGVETLRTAIARKEKGEAHVYASFYAHVESFSSALRAMGGSKGANLLFDDATIVA